MELDINMITDLIKNLGFPIFVCLYFMLRFEKILKANTTALHALLAKIK